VGKLRGSAQIMFAVPGNFAHPTRRVPVIAQISEVSAKIVDVLRRSPSADPDPVFDRGKPGNDL
jgi:hypothetical protein